MGKSDDGCSSGELHPSSESLISISSQLLSYSDPRSIYTRFGGNHTHKNQSSGVGYKAAVANCTCPPTLKETHYRPRAVRNSFFSGTIPLKPPDRQNRGEEGGAVLRILLFFTPWILYFTMKKCIVYRMEPMIYCNR